MSLINGRRAFFLSSTSKSKHRKKCESLADAVEILPSYFFMNISRGCDSGRFKYSTSSPCHKQNVFECSRMINMASGSSNKSSFNIFDEFFACENRFHDGKLHCRAIKVEFQLKRLTMILMRLWGVFAALKR
jgi:hypothetical protein